MLGVDAIPVALGIYLVFCDPARAETFRASRFHSRATTPRVRLSVKRFEDYRAQLAPLMAFYTERGRLPAGDELAQPEFTPASDEFGNLKRAFKIVLQATDASEWEAIAEKRRQDLLVPLLRLYEGCAARVFGRPDTATLVKLHANKPQVTYLECPDFDRLPHPLLQASMRVDLRDPQVFYRDYRSSDDPPLLHQKEQVVASDYPLYEKFAKLSQQERNWGLLDDLPAIFSQSGWQRCLEEHCADLKNHRVVWRKDANPYQAKLQRAVLRSRQEGS